MSVNEQPPPPGIAEEVWFKNRLQQYTQRASMPLPMYQTLSEGNPHPRAFRAQVWVDGICFVSPNSFSTRKMAEQDAAKHALIGIREKVKSEGTSFILQDTFFCKSIIHEYSAKKNLAPTYVTNQSEAVLPVFISSVTLNGVTYVGDAAKNKREAEQLAARSAILLILGSESDTTMSEIVKSKFRFYEALKKVKDSYNASGTVPTEMNSSKDTNDSSDNIPAGENASEAYFSVNKRKEADANRGTDTDSTAVSTIALIPTTQGELSDSSKVKADSLHAFKKPKITSSSAAESQPVVSTSLEAVAPPIEFVPPASGQAMVCSACTQEAEL